MNQSKAQFICLNEKVREEIDNQVSQFMDYSKTSIFFNFESYQALNIMQCNNAYY